MFTDFHKSLGEFILSTFEILYLNTQQNFS